jgi:hypothetical protein
VNLLPFQTLCSEIFWPCATRVTEFLSTTTFCLPIDILEMPGVSSGKASATKALWSEQLLSLPDELLLKIGLIGRESVDTTFFGIAEVFQQIGVAEAPNCDFRLVCKRLSTIADEVVWSNAKGDLAARMYTYLPTPSPITTKPKFRKLLQWLGLVRQLRLVVKIDNPWGTDASQVSTEILVALLQACHSLQTLQIQWEGIAANPIASALQILETYQLTEPITAMQVQCGSRAQRPVASFFEMCPALQHLTLGFLPIEMGKHPSMEVKSSYVVRTKDGMQVVDLQVVANDSLVRLLDSSPGLHKLQIDARLLDREEVAELFRHIKPPVESLSLRIPPGSLPLLYFPFADSLKELSIHCDWTTALVLQTIDSLPAGLEVLELTLGLLFHFGT